MEGIYLVPIPYETFVPAAKKALQRLPAGWRDFKSEDKGGYTIFKLNDIELGNYGTVELYKVGNLTELLARVTQFSRRSTGEGPDVLEAIPDELYHRRRSHFATVIQAMFYKLHGDLILRRYLQAEGNTAALVFLAKWAGEESEADSGAVAEQTMRPKGSAGDILPAELKIGGKYGTCRDLTIDEVRVIVAECRAFQEGGGKVPTFYEQLNIRPGEPRSFELETLYGWLYDPKFRPADT
jgi:hypothetical protein